MDALISQLELQEDGKLFEKKFHFDLDEKIKYDNTRIEIDELISDFKNIDECQETIENIYSSLDMEIIENIIDHIKILTSQYENNIREDLK